MRLLKLLLILCVCAAGPAAAGPLEDAVAAARKGDYATALRLLRPLADQGDAVAQLQPRRHVRSRPWRAAGPRSGGVVVSQGRRTGQCPRPEQPRQPCTTPAKACRRTMRQRCRGTARLPSRVLPWPRSTSASCTATAEACRRTMQRRCRGIAKPPNKAMPKPSTTSASCTSEAKACRRTTRRRCRGIARPPTRAMPGQYSRPCTQGRACRRTMRWQWRGTESCRTRRSRPVQPRHL